MIKVSMLAEQFREALNLAAPALDTKGPMVALGSYLVEAGNDEVRVTACNLSLGVRITLGATVEAGGKEAYFGSTLSDWTSKIGDGEMSIRKDKNSTIFQSGRSQLTINQIDAGDFPLVPAWDECTPLATVDADDLVRLLKSAVISCDIESVHNSRPVLECMLVRFMPDKLVVASADGFRMSYLEKPGKYDVDDKADFAIPRKSILALVRLIDAHKPANVDFAVSPNRSQIMARFGPAEWVSGIVDGTFPDVASLVPKVHPDTHHSIRFHSDMISKALAPLVGLSRNNNDVVYLEFEGPEDELTPGRIRLTAVDKDRGSGEAYVDAAITLGQPTDRKIAVASNYLADVLGVLKSQEVQLSMSGRHAALLFRPTSVGDHEEHAQVVMPMVLGEL